MRGGPSSPFVSPQMLKTLKISISRELDSERGHDTYELVVANDCHDTQRLNVMVLWVERGIVSGTIVVAAFAFVAEDYVRDIIRIQIVHLSCKRGILLYSILEGCRILIVARATSTSLNAIAIDVHVGQIVAMAVQVEHTCCVVLTVDKCWQGQFKVGLKVAKGLLLE